MNATVLILFYIKRTKVNKEGLVPIYARVTIDSKRFEFSTNKFVSPDKWSTQTSKIRGNNEEARLINKHLDLFEENTSRLCLGVNEEKFEKRMVFHNTMKKCKFD